MGLAGNCIFDLGVRTPHPLPKKMKMPALFPTPAKLESADGSPNIPSEMIAFCKSEDLQAGMNPWIKKLGIKQAGSSDPASLIIENSKVPHPEGYTLKIGTGKVIIEAGTPAGTFRGLSTLAQLIEQAEDGKIAGIYIEDEPGLNRRGFMLDVSRCKVPTMEELFALIDLIARLGYNELQLYVEHTFAFKDHQTIWKDASPLTAEEIQQIDKYCQERFIELVPNLNSFGHFERWLCHDEYKHMAECPDGFTREQPYIKRDHGTTLRPNEESLSFIDSLYVSYPPNFSSSKFNVGLDEPWELGQGWSREEVEKTGKDKVYLPISTAFENWWKSMASGCSSGQMYCWKNRRMQSSSAPPHPQLSGGTNQPIPLTNRHGRLRNADCPFAWPREWRHGGAFVAAGQRPGKT